MGAILETERQTYQQMWGVEAYTSHSPGERYADVFVEMIGAHHGSVLDAGAGSGKGALALKARGFTVSLCDVTDQGLVPEARDFPFRQTCLWHPIQPQVNYLFGGKVDYVYCSDVLEHVPPTLTMLVASRLLDVARRGVFFSISLVPDQFGAWVGKPLHQTVQSFVDWRDQLAELGTVAECRDLGATGLYWVTP